MANSTYVDEFIKACANEYVETTDEPGGEKLTSAAIISILTILVYHGLKVLLLELKEWVKLGAAQIALKRQEIEKKLIKYAETKELDYNAAKKAAALVAGKITDQNVEKLVKELESR